MKIALRWMVIIALLPGVAGVWMGLVSGLQPQLTLLRAWAVPGGVVLGFFLHRILSRGQGRVAKLIAFVDTFEHEMTHAFVGLLFFRPPSALQVTDEHGGHVKMENVNWAIALAPYLLPFWTALVAVFGLIVRVEWSPYFFGTALVLYGVFLSRILREVHVGQSDLKDRGFVQSVAVILLFHLLLFPIILHISFGTLEWRRCGANFFAFYPVLFDLFRGWFHRGSPLP